MESGDKGCVQDFPLVVVARPQQPGASLALASTPRISATAPAFQGLWLWPHRFRQGSLLHLPKLLVRAHRAAQVLKSKHKTTCHLSATEKREQIEKKESSINFSAY